MRNFIRCQAGRLRDQRHADASDALQIDQRRGIYYALTQATDVGPIVFLDFEATAGIAVEPHQRLATGLLVDRANVVGNIDLMNRGIFGSGHGWTIDWGWPETA